MRLDAKSNNAYMKRLTPSIRQGCEKDPSNCPSVRGYGRLTTNYPLSQRLETKGAER